MIARAALLLVVAGFGLHAYQFYLAEDADESAFGLFFLWPSLPYAACVAVLRNLRFPHAALGGAASILLADLVTHHAVFVRPTDAQSGLLLLFMPLWNLLIIGPIGAVVGWSVGRGLISRAKS